MATPAKSTKRKSNSGLSLTDEAVASVVAFAKDELNLPMERERVSKLLPWTGAGGPGGSMSYDKSSGVLTMASTLPADFSSVEMLKDFEDLSLTASADPHGDIISLCWKLFELEPMVGAAIETMIALAATKPIVHTKNPELKNILQNYWIDGLNHYGLPKEAARTIPGLREFTREVLLHWFVTADAVWVENWETLSPRKGLPSATFPTETRVHEITTLSLLEQFLGSGYEVIAVKIASLGEKLKEAVKNPATKEDRLLRKMVSPAVRKAIMNEEDTAILPGEITWHMSRHKRSSSLHGTTFVRRAFSPTAIKRVGQAVDMSILRGMVAQLIILQLGDEDPTSKYHKPGPSRVSALNRIMQNIKNISMVAWAGKDIHPVTIAPDPDILKIDSRYQAADDMISLSMAMSRLFIDGVGSGSQQHDWAAFLSMLAKLDYPRSQIEAYYNITARKIADQNGFEKEEVWMRLQRVNLTDRTFKNIFLNAWEKGLTGRRDTLEELGMNPDMVIERHLEEMDQKLNSLIQPPTVPYSAPGTGGPSKPAPDEGRPEGPAASAADEDPMLAGWRVHLLSTIAGIEKGIFESQKKVGRHREVLAAGQGLLINLFGRMAKTYREVRLMKAAEDDEIGRWLDDFLISLIIEAITDMIEVMEVLEEQADALGGAALEGAMRGAFREGAKAMEGLLPVVARKAVWAGELTVQSAGYPAAKIVVKGKGCECCSKLDGQVLSVEDLWKTFPCAEGCDPEFHWRKTKPRSRRRAPARKKT